MLLSLSTNSLNLCVATLSSWRKLAVLVIALALPSTAMAMPFTGINFFGDSLTDTGNIFTVTGGAIPDSNYFNGRFSNGPVYSDRLAAYLGLPIVPSLLGGSNFAFAAANTDSHSISPSFSVLNQVNTFVAGLGGGTANQDALFVLFAGANNIQDAGVLFGSPAQALSVGLVESAADDILSMINQLSGVGANHFLVINSPDVGSVPRFTEPAIPGLSSFTTDLTITFNDRLEANLDTLSGIDLTRFDIFSFINLVVNNPGDFNLINTSDRCYTGDDINFTGGGTICADPDQYLYYDGLHPTAFIHDLAAQQMLIALNVPEPDSIALLLIGLISIGWSRSRIRVS